MSAALVESVRFAVAMRDYPGPERESSRSALDLPAILAALTEGEALRAQVVESRAERNRAATDANHLRLVLAQCLAAWEPKHNHKGKDGASDCMVCIARGAIAAVKPYEFPPTDTAALRKMLETAVMATAQYIVDNQDAFDAQEFYDLLANPNYTDRANIVDRVLGGS